jgi:hypothetical protein
MPLHKANAKTIHSLLRKDQLFFLFVWSMLAFSFCQLLYTYNFILKESGLNYVFTACLLTSIFFLSYSFLVRHRFATHLSFPYYMIVCVVYSLLTFLFSCLYHRLITLDALYEYYLVEHALWIAILNILLSAILFPLTLIKKK